MDPLRVQFTEPVRTESVTYSITPFVKGRLKWDEEGRVGVFHHEAFQEKQTYTFTLRTARDMAGNPLMTPTEFLFTTVEIISSFLPIVSK